MHSYLSMPSPQVRQNVGVKIITIVNSSKRPSNIAKVQIQVWKSVSTAKVVAGPTRLRPGPMLLTEATTAESAVTTSHPLASINKVQKIMEASLR